MSLEYDPTKAPFEDQSPIPDITDEELRRHVVHTRRDVAEIKMALVGSPKYGIKGYGQRLDTVETVQAEHSKRFLVWGTIISVAGTALVFLKDYFKPHS